MLLGLGQEAGMGVRFFGSVIEVVADVEFGRALGSCSRSLPWHSKCGCLSVVQCWTFSLLVLELCVCESKTVDGAVFSGSKLADSAPRISHGFLVAAPSLWHHGFPSQWQGGPLQWRHT